jgi:tetratricopeptide (TPR) repeat protein
VQRVNFKFLLILIVAVATLLGGAILLRRFQVSRNAGSKLELAKQKLEDGKAGEALDLFAQYVGLRPDDDEAYAEYAKLLVGRAQSPDATRNDFARAYAAMETAVRRNPDDDPLRRALAEFQISVGRASDAREHLAVLKERQEKLSPEEAAEQADDINRIELLLAASFIGEGDSEEAAAMVAKLVGYDLDKREFIPGFDGTKAEADSYVMLAGILESRLESKNDAKAVLDRLVETHPDETRSWLAMTTWHRSQKEFDKAAETVAKALEIDADDVNAIFADFELALAQKDIDRAEATAAKAIELYPDDERSYRGYAAVSLQQGDLAQAEQTLLDGVGRLPRQRSLLLMLTDVLLQENKLTEAAQALVRIREQYDATSVPVQILEARLLVAEQRWSDAKKVLEQVRPMALGNPDLIRQVDLYLAQCHSKLNEFDAQLEVNRRVLSDDPTSLAARAGAAQALVSSGKVAEALVEFESLASSLQRPQLARLPQIWYPLLQLRINTQSALPETERDWSKVDDLLDLLQEANAVNPIQLALLRAETLIRRGEKKAAMDLLEEAATASADPLVWAGLATLELRTSGRDAARAVLDRTPEAARNAPPVLLVESQLAVGLPSTEAAEIFDAIEKRADTLPDDAAAQVLVMLAPLRLSAGDTAGAERLWRAAAEKNPDDLGIREALMDIAATEGNPEKASAAAADIIRIAGAESARGRVAQASVRILEARLELQKIEKAEGAINEIPPAVRDILDEARNRLIEAETERPGWSLIQILFAEVEVLRGERVAAIDRLQKAVNAGATNPIVVRRLVALLYQAGRLDEAQKAMALLGESGEQGLERIAAEVAFREGRLEEAANLAEQSVSSDTRRPEDLLWLGQLLARVGKKERAAEVLEKATELAPNDPEVWLALFTHRVSAEIPDAEKPLQKAATLIPEPRRQIALAQGYEMLSRDAEAAQALRDAITSFPENVEAMRALASFELRKGDRSKARDLLEKILAASETDPFAADAKPWARRATAEVMAQEGSYADLQKGLEMLSLNRDKNGKSPMEDLELEINLLANRPEPASWRQALKRLDELASLKSLSTSECLSRAQLREKVGRWDEARNELVALVAKPETPPAYVAMLAEKMIEHGEASAAVTWLRRLERAAPDSPITIALQAKLAMAEGDRQQAGNFARKLMPGEGVPADNPAQLAAVAKLMEDLGFPKAADKVLEQFAAISGDGLVARIEFLGRQGRGGDALDLLQANWEVFPLERAVALAIQVFRNQVDDSTVAAVGERVGQLVAKARREDPGSFVLKLIDADFLSLNGGIQESEAIYRELLATGNLPTVQAAIVANNLAFFLAKPATAAEARKLIDLAIAQLGPLPDLLDTRGLVRLAEGDRQGAIEDLREAILVPSSLKYLHLAAAELAAGDQAAAGTALEKARTSGLNKIRLVQVDAERLEQIEKSLGQTAAVTAAGRE